MARGLFISEKYVKENSVIDDNVDMKLIQPTIWQCQKQYIEAYLGTQLYDDINSKVVASTLAGDDLTLVNDYIADSLLYWVVYELQVSLLFKMRNVGTSTERSDFSSPVDLKQLARVENRFKKKAEYFSERLTAYLCANTDLYPLYLITSESDDLLPESAKPTTSVFLGSTAMPKCNKYLYTTNPDE